MRKAARRPTSGPDAPRAASRAAARPGGCASRTRDDRGGVARDVACHRPRAVSGDLDRPRRGLQPTRRRRRSPRPPRGRRLVRPPRGAHAAGRAAPRAGEPCRRARRAVPPSAQRALAEGQTWSMTGARSARSCAGPVKPAPASHVGRVRADQPVKCHPRAGFIEAVVGGADRAGEVGAQTLTGPIVKAVVERRQIRPQDRADARRLYRCAARRPDGSTHSIAHRPSSGVACVPYASVSIGAHQFLLWPADCYPHCCAATRQVKNYGNRRAVHARRAEQGWPGLHETCMDDDRPCTGSARDHADDEVVGIEPKPDRPSRPGAGAPRRLWRIVWSRTCSRHGSTKSSPAAWERRCRRLTPLGRSS